MQVIITFFSNSASKNGAFYRKMNWLIICLKKDFVSKFIMKLFLKFSFDLLLNILQ